MSTQFAGVAVAEKHGLYTDKNIRLNLLPECPPGLEPQRVRDYYDAEGQTSLCVGTIEQNILFPVLAASPSLQMSAVAAMFARSPLGLAALPTHPTALQGDLKDMVVGAHEDTVDLLQGLLPKAKVIGVSRDQKMGLLKTGEIDAVQVYDVMETLMLEEEFSKAPRYVPLHSLGANLGYSQVIFAPTESLADSEQKMLLQDFLSVTFDGWQECIKNPRSAAKAVIDMQNELGVKSDHWIDTLDFTELTVKRCCDYVKATSRGGRYGVIQPDVWSDAQKWMSTILPNCSGARDMLTMDTDAWVEDPRLMHGKGLADKIRANTVSLVNRVLEISGRQPSLAVITLGQKPTGGTHKDALRRLQLYSPLEASWFSKSKSGEYLRITVEEIHMPEATTTEELIKEIKKHSQKDGIQLMWPLPNHIDAEKAYREIGYEQDVDGAHYIGRMETAGGHERISKGLIDLYKNAPVTPLAVVKLLQHYKVDPASKKILVIGRSRIVGQPLAYMLTALGGAVTIAHTGTPKDVLAAACKEADILIPCVGLPGLIEGSWVKEDSVVVNVGTTFLHDELVPDIPRSSELDLLSHAKYVATCPGGVGPLSVAVLFENVAANALAKCMQKK